MYRLEKELTMYITVVNLRTTWHFLVFHRYSTSRLEAERLEYEWSICAIWCGAKITSSYTYKEEIS